MACDTSTLNELAKCFECLSMKQLEAINAYLLCQILEAGGGGGGSSAITHGVGSPITGGISVVTYKLYIDDSSGSIWAVVNGAWLQITA